MEGVAEGVQVTDDDDESGSFFFSSLSSFLSWSSLRMCNMYGCDADGDRGRIVQGVNVEEEAEEVISREHLCEKEEEENDPLRRRLPCRDAEPRIVDDAASASMSRSRWTGKGHDGHGGQGGVAV